MHNAAARMRETAPNLETIFDIFPFVLMMTRDYLSREEMDVLFNELSSLLGPQHSQDANGQWDFFGSSFLFKREDDAVIAKMLAGGELLDMKKLLAGIEKVANDPQK